MFRADARGTQRPAAIAWLSAVRLPGVDTLLWHVLVLGAGAYILVFLACAAARVLFPYPLDLYEGTSLQQVMRILGGQPLFGAPTRTQVPEMYAPLYFYASAAVAAVTGPSLLPLRLVSLGASLGSLALVFRFVQRETDSWRCGLAAAGLLAATFPLWGTVTATGVVDATFLCLLLAALFAARSAELHPRQSARLWALAGCLTGLAILTKQPGVLAGAALSAYLLLQSRRWLIAYAAGAAVTLGIFLLAMWLQSGAWLKFYLVDLPRKPVHPDRFFLFVGTDILPHLSIALVIGGIFLLDRALRNDWRATRFYGMVALTLVAVSAFGRMYEGGWINVLGPAFAGCAILFGLGLHQARSLVDGDRRRGLAVWAYLLGAGALQLLVLWYQPRGLVPLRSDTWSGDRLVARIATLPGSVFAPDYDLYSRAAGKGEQPYVQAIEDLRSGAPSVGDAWLAALGDDLNRRAYDYVLVDPDSYRPWLMRVLDSAGYREAGPLFPNDDVFWQWQPPNVHTPAARVFVPRERINEPNLIPH